MGRSTYFLIVSLSISIPLEALAQASALDPALIAEGAKVYTENCQRCHNPRIPSERTDREWVVIVQHMQIRANLTTHRARAVRAFLLASNEPGQVAPAERPGLAGPIDTAAVSDSTITVGRSVFRGPGGCIACHGPQLQGGPIAPDLSDARWKNGDGSLASIYSIVRRGVSGTAMVAYPGGIGDEQARAVAAYVWSVSHGRAAP